MAISDMLQQRGICDQSWKPKKDRWRRPFSDDELFRLEYLAIDIHARAQKIILPVWKTGDIGMAVGMACSCDSERSGPRLFAQPGEIGAMMRKPCARDG